MVKRFLSMLLAFCMIVSLVPAIVYADDGSDSSNSVVYGYYGKDGWEEGEVNPKNPTDIDIYGIKVVDKTAKATNIPNEYEITLTIETEEKVTPITESAATVLVIDTSGSMSGSRIRDTKTAAKNFLKAYTDGAESGSGRYVAVVSFNNTCVRCL